MKDIILHIGLSKAASTTLQTRVFPALHNYYGKSAASKLRRIISTDPTLARRETVNQLINWVEKLSIGEKSAEEVGRETILLSDEHLASFAPGGVFAKDLFVSSRKLENFRKNDLLPIAGFLNELKSFWPSGRVRVLLILRNQADWLASRYAQSASRFLSASQVDFEASISRILELNRTNYCLNWYQLVVELQHVLGAENVEVLVLEEIFTETFWSRLDKFLSGNKKEDEIQYGPNLVRSNNRRLDEQCWALRDIVSTSNLLSCYVNRSNFNKPTRQGLASILSLLAQVEKSLGDLPLSFLRGRREREISLSPGMRKTILEHVSISNERLGKEVLSKDLKSLGYFY